MLIGYARVSTDDQDTAAQLDALRAAGCTVIYEDKASGGSRDRPQLNAALDRAGKGDTLIVMRLDRLARSLSHLLDIIKTLKARGAHFQSIADKIDTDSAQGMLMMQMLGAFAEFEKNLIKERTTAGIKAAVARGSRPGNPKMISGDRIARIDIGLAHKERYLAELIDGRRHWLPIVERLRPDLSWAVVLRQIEASSPNARSFSERTLIKAAKALVAAGYANEAILGTAKRMPPDTEIPLLLADKLATAPDMSLRDLAKWLSTSIKRPTPRGGLKWSAEGVRRQIERAKNLGLL